MSQHKLFDIKLSKLNDNEAGVGFRKLDKHDLANLQLPGADWKKKCWGLKWKAPVIDRWHIIELRRAEMKCHVCVGYDATNGEVACIPDVTIMGPDNRALLTVSGDLYFLNFQGIGKPHADQIMRLVWTLRGAGVESLLHRAAVVSL